MVHWNQEGFKVGHCYQPPLNQPYSVLALTNSSGTRHILNRLRQKFLKIYKQRVFIHHYEKFMGGDYLDHFQESLLNCESVIESYYEMEQKHQDVKSGRFEMSGGVDCTSNEFIDSQRYVPLL